MLPLMLDHVAEGRMTLARLVDMLCAGPARIFGIAGKGRIVRGYDADFTLVDLRARREIAAGWLTSRRSEEHTSELQSLMRISSAVFCLTKKKNKKNHTS